MINNQDSPRRQTVLSNIPRYSDGSNHLSKIMTNTQDGEIPFGGDQRSAPTNGNCLGKTQQVRSSYFVPAFMSKISDNFRKARERCQQSVNDFCCSLSAFDSGFWFLYPVSYDWTKQYVTSDTRLQNCDCCLFCGVIYKKQHVAIIAVWLRS